MIYLKALVVWGLFLAVTLASDVMREQILLPYVGERIAYDISTIAVCLLCLGIIGWFVRWTTPTTVQALLIGLLWLCRTVLAQVVFVHYVLGRPWAVLMADYNMLHGRLGSFVILT